MKRTIIADTISNIEQFRKLFLFVANEYILKGVIINIIVEPVKQFKTLKQLGFIFKVIIGSLQKYYLELHGKVYEVNVIKDYLYLRAGLKDKKQYPNGIEYEKTYRLSEMTIEQTTKFINNLLNLFDNDIEFEDFRLPPSARYTWVLHVTDEDSERVKEKHFPKKSLEFLAHIRKQNCINCGVFGSEPHHLRSGGYAGMGLKSPDWFTIPLCRDCHENGAHRNEKALLENLRYVLKKKGVETFCRLCFDRWYNKRYGGSTANNYLSTVP